MNFYTGLLYKDWKLSIKGQLQNFLLLFIIWLVGVVASLQLNEPVIVAGLGVTLIVMHVFYIGTDLFVCLRREQKLKIWLHNPSPTHALLSSKLVISTFNCLVSIAFAVGLYGIACWLIGESFLQGKELPEAFAMLLSVLCIGLYLGVWAIFIFSQFAAARGKRFEKLRYFLYGFLTYFIIQVHNGFLMSPVYDRMKELGTFPALTIGTKLINESEGYQEFSLGVSISNFSWALTALFIAISLIVFFLSVRYVKKMEI